ncbi:acyl carrier protein [Amycolatopsis sp. H20-H5]|uniref:acyl carrier protein n=1 Tax=Amycolatopsis sp. H20-H5 TaxID=3046309 RepID=UPI002DB96B2D|nr:phosphopantetheine-binding protein [Amycolatopsis sp. H20-H5]MEC3982734.1 phosphopantetheine-binding protein [Amycolatopsis sp. H20-H5]
MQLNQTTGIDVFDTVAALLTDLVGDVDVLGIEITRETTFHEDLQLESIDLVTFAGILAEHFGAKVNLAEFLAEKDLDEVIELRVGDIAGYVAGRLSAAGRS